MDFDETLLVLHLAGRLDAQRSQQIADAADRDPEVAAMLEVIGDISQMCGHTQIQRRTSEARKPTRRVARILGACRSHPIWLALVLIGVFSGMAGASWVWLVPHYLLYDDFDDGWFDSRLWMRTPSMGPD